ncbi:MAG: LCP family protein [Chloroflexota bacterium]|nr:LCP family protein [Chloroflexota bacterium]
MSVIRRRLGAFALAASLLAVAFPGVAASPSSLAPGRPSADPERSMGRAADALGDLVDRASEAGAGFRSAMDALSAASAGAAGSEGPTINYGSDGRLTILLLGSDYRAGYKYLEHTDVIMVVSLDPAGSKLAMASVPRSVVRFPIHLENRGPDGAKHSGDLRVNLLYDSYRETEDDGGIEPQALERLRKDVAHALRLEIDYYAFVRFTGFDALVDTADGIAVKIPAAIVDPSYQDSPTPGVRFPAASDWLLHGGSATRCAGTTIDCRRGIAYVRSRKGKVGSAANSDYQRAARQQGLIFAAIQKVTGGGADLELLRLGSISHVTTDMPRTAADAMWLRDRLAGARAPLKARVVFAPPTWATALSVPKDSARLRLKEVRAWIAQKMPAVAVP